MANWLLDYVEMTEYIPAEFRDQSFLMRELDLKVTIAMSDLDQEIKDFFSKIDTLSVAEKQIQYDQLLEICDLATKAAGDKIDLADRLHDLVGKSLRLLDQSLEKLKEDLMDGDKAYVVENLERQSDELDEKNRLELESMMQKHNKLKELKSNHSRSNSNYLNKATNKYNLSISKHSDHHHQIPHHIQRSRNNSTETRIKSMKLIGKQKRREKKHLNGSMTTFDRTLRPDEDSTNQTYLSSSSSPEYLNGLENSNSSSLADVSYRAETNSVSIHGKVGSTRFLNCEYIKTNGNDIRAIVRPNNSDNYGHLNQNGQFSQLTSHLLSSVAGYNRLNSAAGVNHYNNITSNYNNGHHIDRSTRPFSTLAGSRHDPIMMAASQAINATQNMTSGRRTSSLKASYEAANSGRLQSPQSDYSRFDLPPGEIYCKCRNAIHDPNMIACDNGNCEYEWFHYQCVGITTPPEGEWYCDDCRVLRRSQNYITTTKKSKTTPVAGQSNNKID